MSEKFINICTVIEDKGSFYIQFLTGDYFSLNEMKWDRFSVPFSSFNIANLNGQPVILGEATQIENKIIGSRKVSLLDKVLKTTIQ